MKKKNIISLIIIFIILIVAIGGIVAFKSIAMLSDDSTSKHKSSDNESFKVVLYGDSQHLIENNTERLDKKPTVEDLADLLSDCSGLDYKINDVKVDGDSVYIDWDEDASLLVDATELELLSLKDGFYFEDLDSLQHFMLDSLVQTIMMNLDYDYVYFTFNNGDTLELVFGIINQDEPYLWSSFYNAHSDNIGDDSDSYYSYFDSDNQLLIEYPTSFSEEPFITENTYLNFTSKQENNGFVYWVTPNTYNESITDTCDRMQPEEFSLLPTENTMALRTISTDPNTGDVTYNAVYVLVEDNYIAIINVLCETYEQTEYWYDVICSNGFIITDVSGMDMNQMGEDSFDTYFYFDEINHLILNYPTNYTSYETIDTSGAVTFDSIQNESKLVYSVFFNVYNETPDTFLDSVNVIDSDRLGDNIIIGKCNTLNQETGEYELSAIYWRIEKDWIAMASIESSSMSIIDDAYQTMLDGYISIELITDDSSENNDSDMTTDIDLYWDELKYYDMDYHLILTYPELFSAGIANGVIWGANCILFESAEDDSYLSYLVKPNTDELDVDTFAGLLNGQQIKILPSNVVIADLIDEDNNYYVLYCVVDIENIVIISIDCETQEDCHYWFDMLQNNIVYVEGFSESEINEIPLNEDSLADQYKISRDGINITEKMNLSLIDGELYAEIDSYFDAFTTAEFDNPYYYSQYDESTGNIDVFSWATDTVILYFEPGNKDFYCMYEDNVTYSYKIVSLDSDIKLNENNTIMIPLEAMTNYLFPTPFDGGYTIENNLLE